MVGCHLRLNFSHFSIAYGVIAGVLSYVLINGVPLLLKKLSNGRIIPPNYYEDSEEWVIPPGSMIPYWMCVMSYDLMLPHDNFAIQPKTTWSNDQCGYRALRRKNPRRSEFGLWIG
jgi:hypothetical protein